VPAVGSGWGAEGAGSSSRVLMGVTLPLQPVASRNRTASEDAAMRNEVFMDPSVELRPLEESARSIACGVRRAARRVRTIRNAARQVAALCCPAFVGSLAFANPTEAV